MTGARRPALGLGLGLDVGGTATRWALASQEGSLLAEGSVGGFTALLLGQPGGPEAIAATLAGLARQLDEATHGRPTDVCIGITGYSDDPRDRGPRDALAALVRQALGVAPSRVRVLGDIELAYRDALMPGEGYLVYAGTGSVAAFIDTEGTMHRVGGHGSLLDDGGSGYWIAREALRGIWRAEDEHPGAWRDSPMARAVFDHIGGSDWARTREFVYQSGRGTVGELALAVASAADTDPRAHAIMAAAGRELARLALLLARRFGARRVVLAGRAVTLHPAIEAHLRAALPGDMPAVLHALRGHGTAARLALSLPPVS